MRLPRILVYESDGAMSRGLRASVTSGPLLKTSDNPVGKWSLRRVRHFRSVKRYLKLGSPAVLLLKIGADLVRELTLMERVHRVYPSVPVVVVADGAHEPVHRLCWDFGAACVLISDTERLPEVAVALMESAIAHMRSLHGQPAQAEEAVIELDEP